MSGALFTVDGLIRLLAQESYASSVRIHSEGGVKGTHWQVVESNLYVSIQIGIGGLHWLIGPGTVIGCGTGEKAARIAEAASKPPSTINLNSSKITPPRLLFDFCGATDPSRIQHRRFGGRRYALRSRTHETANFSHAVSFIL